MYQLQLTESLVAPQDDDVIKETTVGGVLRSAAAAQPDTAAMLELDMEGQTGRSWTYRELLADS